VIGAGLSGFNAASGDVDGIFGDPYTGYNRRYLKLKMRLTPYLYTYSREAYDTGVPTVRAMVLEFPGDTTTWSKRTQYQLMNGE